MAKKIRKQTLSLSSYLEKVKEEDISDNQDVQRKFCWDKNAINELVVTVLTDDYIPPIILGEEEIGNGVVQQYITDGLQRSSALILFRYGKYRITSAIENSIIEYQRKKHDEKGICKDEDGSVIWEVMTFDIKGKGYDDLPPELKKSFDDYQIDIVIHQDCTMEKISKLVRRYNNHKSMNVAQKAFTYVDKHARKIRNITAHRFFKDCGSYTEKEKSNGVYERIICESVMTMFHLENWQKQGKKMGAFLNANATPDEFEALEDVLNHMESTLSDNYQEIFTSKDSFLWFTLYYKFMKLGADDYKFAEFLDCFKNELHSKTFSEYGGESFDSLDANKSTKDKKVIVQKLSMLEQLMRDFLHIEETIMENRELTPEQFIADNAGLDIQTVRKDMDFYSQMLDDLEDRTIKDGSKLLNPDNRLSLVTLVAYTIENDIDLDEWMLEYAKNNNTYFMDKKKNFLHMKQELKKYLEKKGVAA